MTTPVAAKIAAAVHRKPTDLEWGVLLTRADAVALWELLRDHAEMACDDCSVPLDEDYGVAVAAPSCLAHQLCTNCAPYRTCRDCNEIARETA